MSRAPRCGGSPMLTYPDRVRPFSVRVRLISFGPLKSIFAEGGEWRELPSETSVEALLVSLTASGVVSDMAARSAAVAVNQEYASPRHILQEGDEVAILPPVSGGSDPLSAVRLTREPIESGAVQRQIKAGADGAVVVFDGIVRDNTRGRATLHLDYEAYEEMALKQMMALREDAISRFKVRDAAIVHRLGRLMVGETSVLIVVGSAHRAVAFEACRWIIDTLKKTVPIWKKEQFVDGAVWADGEPFPRELGS